MSLSLTALYELVFPCHCEACGGLPESGQYRFLCGSCAGRMIWVGEEYCRSCGYPYAGGVGAARRCVKCDELQPVFSAGRSLLLHQGPGGALVRALKYRRALHLREDLARIVRHVSGLADYVASSVLVPVPLYGLRQRERGFNQAQVLAEVIAGSFAGLTVEELLVRVRATSTQTRLTREDRQANVKKAFAMRDNARVERSVKYIIVDDVYTTGATLNACAEVLSRAGAQDIRVLTLAHG